MTTTLQDIKVRRASAKRLYTVIGAVTAEEQFFRNRPRYPPIIRRSLRLYLKKDADGPHDDEFDARVEG